MDIKPKQAVILAGGRGTRLAPLTDTLPKPMIAFHGKPFLEYLIVMLGEQGISEVVMLLGYMPEPIMDYFQDGKKWGIRITYHVTPVDDDTGARLKSAHGLLDPIFLLMYCDNYWPLPLDHLWKSFVAANVSAQVVVYRNSDGASRDNLKVDGEGRVVIYDKSRTAPGLQGVDLGFLIMRRELVADLPDGNISLERELYPRLIENRQLQAYVTDHRYYSVGDLKRLPITDRFLSREPAILIDRDGVLNQKAERARYIRSWEEWTWLPGVLDALCLLNKNRYRVMIVTNQAGIARGAMSESSLNEIHERMRKDVDGAGGHIDAVYHCPHGWDDGCECRKPKPGMLFQAQREFHLDLSRVPFVGDDPRDGEAAVAAGCPFFEVSETKPLIEVVREILDPKRELKEKYS